MMIYDGATSSTWIPLISPASWRPAPLHLRFSKASTDHGFLAAWQFVLSPGLGNSERKTSTMWDHVSHPLIVMTGGLLWIVYNSVYKTLPYIAPRIRGGVACLTL